MERSKRTLPFSIIFPESQNISFHNFPRTIFEQDSNPRRLLYEDFNVGQEGWFLRTLVTAEHKKLRRKEKITSITLVDSGNHS